MGSSSTAQVKNLEDDRSELLDAIERAAWEWRRTFDAVETPIVIVGLDASVARINRAARMLVGRQYGEIVGRSLRELPSQEPWSSMTDLTHEVQQRRSPGSATGERRAGPHARICWHAVQLRRSRVMSASS